MASGHERLGGRADGLDVVLAQGLLQTLKLLSNVGGLILGELVALVGQQLVGLVHEVVGVVANLGLCLSLLILISMGLRVAHHLIDDVLVERRLTGDGHGLLVVGCPVLGRHVDDAVGVDVEGDLDLGGAPGGGRQVDQLELAQRLVELRHLAFALQHVDLDGRLAVLGSGEHLGPLNRNGGVALDEPSHDTALGLDAQRQRGDVQQEHVLDLADQHTGLDRGADGHHLVRVDVLRRVAAGNLLSQIDHRGHPGGAADQDHVVDLALGETGVLHSLLERRPATGQ